MASRCQCAVRPARLAFLQGNSCELLEPFAEGSSSRRRNALLSRRLTRLPPPFGPMSRSLAMLVRSLAVSPKADLARLAGLSLANPEELSVVPNHL
jgi:hypothetical protein